MSALNFTTSAPENTYTGGTSTTAMTLVAPTNQRVRIKGLYVFGKGTTNTDTPPRVELIIFAAFNTSGANSGNVTKKCRDGDISETIQSSTAGIYTTEPTYTSSYTIETWEVHPQTGIIGWFDNDPIVLKGGTGIAIRVTPNQNESLAISLQCEE